MKKILAFLALSGSLFAVDKCLTHESKGNPFECGNYGNCTWWAYKMGSEDLKKALIKKGSGRDAKNWITIAKEYNLPTGDTPKVGAIAVFEKMSNYGHVAYVTKVDNNSLFEVSQMDWFNSYSNPIKGVTYRYNNKLLKDGSKPSVKFIYPNNTDTTKPTASISNLNGVSIKEGASSIATTINASDNQTLAKVTLQIANSATSSLVVNQSWNNSSTSFSTSYNVPTSSLKAGAYNYTLFAKDLSGNLTEVKGSFKVTTASSTTVYGIDVSKNNGYIDWKSVKNKDIAFAFIRSTEGYADASWPESSAYDSRFEQNMNNAINEGIVVGAYHFARPDFNKNSTGAKNEAKYFVGKVKYYYQNNKMLPPVIDIEKTSSSYTKTTLTDWVVSFAKEVETQLGIKPIVYMSQDYYNNKLNASSLSSYKLWISRPLYNEKSGIAINTLDDIKKYDPSFKPSVNDWLFWQYSYTGTNINSKNLDRNVFKGTLSELKALLVQSTKR